MNTAYSWKLCRARETKESCTEIKEATWACNALSTTFSQRQRPGDSQSDFCSISLFFNPFLTIKPISSSAQVLSGPFKTVGGDILSFSNH